MQVTLFSDSLSYIRCRKNGSGGLFQVAAAFGAPFNQDRGRLVRLSIEHPRRWRAVNSAWHRRRIGRSLDNYGPFLHGFHLGPVFWFRYYRRIAVHISLLLFTVSFVRGTWGPTCHRRTFSVNLRKLGNRLLWVAIGAGAGVVGFVAGTIAGLLSQ
jgi:hypothetical protein